MDNSTAPCQPQAAANPNHPDPTQPTTTQPEPTHLEPTQSEPTRPESAQPESTQPDTYEKIPAHRFQAPALPDPATRSIEYEDVLEPGATPVGYYNVPKQGYENVEASHAAVKLGSGHYLDVGPGQNHEMQPGYELSWNK